MNEHSAEQNVANGLMFHDFCNDKHLNGPGAISADQFENIIQYHKDNLLSANEWFDKAKTNTLDDKDLC